MQVDKYFGLAHHEGALGLELEIEGKRPPVHLTPGADMMWLSKMEGSLRGHGMEYVSYQPLWNNSAKTNHVKRLCDYAQMCKANPNSPRTSLHVHFNVQKYSFEKLYSLVCAYWLLENILVKYCGEQREGNHFCLRLVDAEYLLKAINDDIRTERHLQTLIGNRALRYSAINLAAVPKFGSVEFRAMRGTIDPKLIDRWSSELHNLCIKAKQFKHPADLLDFYFVSSKEEFLETFFSVEFCKELASFKGWRDMISENEGPVCELAYVKDWDKPIIENKPRLQKKRSTINMDVLRGVHGNNWRFEQEIQNIVTPVPAVLDTTVLFDHRFDFEPPRADPDIGIFDDPV